MVAGSDLFDAVFALSTEGDAAGEVGWLDPSAAERVGLGEVTLLAVRPDGYVGLRADASPAAELRHYVGLVTG